MKKRFILTALVVNKDCCNPGRMSRSLEPKMSSLSKSFWQMLAKCFG
jgi:hypothetical protein